MTADTNMSYWTMFKQAIADWSEDKATKLAAALAFYTMLSIAPLLIISIKIVSVVFRDTADAKIEGYLASTMGTKAAEAVADMIKNQPPGAGILATTVGIIILLFSASGVFGELQDSLNTIWEVKPKPNQGIWATIKARFFSFTLVLGVAFLLLVSLVASAILSGMASKLGGGESVLWKLVHFAISLGVITGLFAMMFRYLPDVRISWRNVWVGAALTAVLFTIGKFLLGWYLGRGSTTSVYGAAGSLVALLLWVYYAAQILFFGAEFTQVYARAHGEELEPTENAVKVTEEDRAQQGMVSNEQMAAKAAAGGTGDRPLASGPSHPMPAGGRHVPQRPMAKPAYASGQPFLPAGGASGVPSYALAGAGLLAGVAAGALGALNLKKDPTRVTRKHAAAVKLNERIETIESKLGRAARIKDYLEDVRVNDRIKTLEKKIQAASTQVRAEATGRPKWAVRLADMIAGVK